MALLAAGVLMLDRVRPEKVYRAVDWPLSSCSPGLFIVVHAFEGTVVRTWGLEHWYALLKSPVVLVSGLSLVLSNLVSNVPRCCNKRWWKSYCRRNWRGSPGVCRARSRQNEQSSVRWRNLIVVENARPAAGTELSFLEYLKVGVPLAVPDDPRQRRLAVVHY